MPNPILAVNDGVRSHGCAMVPIDFLANDIVSDYGIDTASVTILREPYYGMLGQDPEGNWFYTPDPGWCGTDRFFYLVCDNWGYCDTAEVVIHISCQTTEANDDFAETLSGEEVNIVVLENDADNVFPGCVSITQEPEHGTVEVLSDGSVLYTPEDGYIGEDCFSYQVCELECGASDQAVVCVNVKEKELIIPEVFTPNGDGYNDFFEIVGILQHPNNELQIYNRWENMVFSTRGYANEWDGSWMKNGKPLPDGTYFYILILDVTDENSPTFNGFTTIQR